MDRRVESIEGELALVREFAGIERKKVEQSPDSKAARFFHEAKETQVAELEAELRLAKEARRSELIELRLRGDKVNFGEIPLHLLAKISASLEAMLVASAHKLITGEEVSAKRADEIRSLMNLRLSHIGVGSTRLFFVGDLHPDTTGESVLESALKSTFDVLNSAESRLGDAVDNVGSKAAQSCRRLLQTLVSAGLQTNFVWQSSEYKFDWNASAESAKSLKQQLDQIGDPKILEKIVVGEVRNLSDTGRVEIRTHDEPRMRIKVPKEKYHLLQSLHLGQPIHANILSYEWQGTYAPKVTHHLKDLVM